MSDWSGAVIAEDDEAKIHRVDGAVWVLEVLGLLGSKMMTRGLDAIWADPAWAQPWGFVLLTHEGVQYEPDLRGYAMPPTDKRSVNTAIVTRNQFHRMVIGSIGIGLKVAKSFPLEVFPEIDEAIAASRRYVDRARADGRTY